MFARLLNFICHGVRNKRRAARGIYYKHPMQIMVQNTKEF